MSTWSATARTGAPAFWMQLMGELAQRLKSTSGKKQYGYLKASLKAVVDEIVDEPAKDTRVSSAYDLWYQLREEVLRTYRDDLPDRLPLSRQTEFKRIKNVVVEEAARLGERTEVFTPADTQEPPQAGEDAGPEPEAESESSDVPEEASEAPPAVVWSDRYKRARSFLYGDDDTPQDHEQAYRLFMEEALGGNALAMHNLGRLLAVGTGVEADAEQSHAWYAKALSAFHAVERQRPNRYVEYRIGKMYAGGLGTEQDDTAAAKWFSQAAARGYQYAQYALGKLYLLGKDIPQDRESAVRWFTLAAEQGNEYARYFLDHMDDSPSLFASATRLLHHMGRIFQEQAPPPSGGISFVDSKLRRKIREKKIAMGYKPDDHEEPVQQLR